eukprot:TRINITY_DN437_c0_g2_i1.p1 TRINITY_DN437_c0_g2~~TRINITY_DN437_c0_g2_i1.p1  ORF type:complete len:1684 (-),score=561.85 TRINITY_DN437_c0_g2_i1:473-5485(-)
MFVREIFYIAPTTPAVSGNRRKSVQIGGASKAVTISLKFKRQLGLLYDILLNTSAHYIRCIKPNKNKSHSEIESKMVLDQLLYSGVLETVDIRRQGFPFREEFNEFWYRISTIGLLRSLKRYLKTAPKDELKKYDNVKWTDVDSLTPRKGCELLLKIVLNDEHWQLGKTKVFMKDHCMNQLLNWQRELEIIPIQAGIRRMIQRRKYLKYRRAIISTQRGFHRLMRWRAIERVIPLIIRFQSQIRGIKARKIAYRLKNIRRLSAVDIQKIWRGVMPRKRLKAAKTFAIRIQTLARRRQQQQKYQKIQKAVIAIQPCIRGLFARRRCRVLRKLAAQRRRIVRSQALVRGFIARESFLEFLKSRIKSAILIQSKWREYVNRCKYRKIKIGINHIKAHFKGSKQRVATANRKRAIIVLQSTWKMILERRRLIKVKRAAVRIQSWRRSLVCWKHFQTLLKSARRIERACYSRICAKRLESWIEEAMDAVDVCEVEELRELLDFEDDDYSILKPLKKSLVNVYSRSYNRDNDQRRFSTLLHESVVDDSDVNERIELVELLMEAGANVSSPNHYNQSPLFLCAKFGDVMLECSKLLVEHAQPDELARALTMVDSSSGKNILDYLFFKSKTAGTSGYSKTLDLLTKHSSTDQIDSQASKNTKLSNSNGESSNEITSFANLSVFPEILESDYVDTMNDAVHELLQLSGNHNSPIKDKPSKPSVDISDFYTNHADSSTKRKVDDSAVDAMNDNNDESKSLANNSIRKEVENDNDNNDGKINTHKAEMKEKIPGDINGKTIKEISQVSKSLNDGIVKDNDNDNNRDDNDDDKTATKDFSEVMEVFKTYDIKKTKEEESQLNGNNPKKGISKVSPSLRAMASSFQDSQQRRMLDENSQRATSSSLYRSVRHSGLGRSKLPSSRRSRRSLPPTARMPLFSEDNSFLHSSALVPSDSPNNNSKNKNSSTAFILNNINNKNSYASSSSSSLKQQQQQQQQQILIPNINIQQPVQTYLGSPMARPNGANTPTAPSVSTPTGTRHVTSPLKSSSLSASGSQRHSITIVDSKKISGGDKWSPLPSPLNPTNQPITFFNTNSTACNNNNSNNNNNDGISSSLQSPSSSSHGFKNSTASTSPFDKKHQRLKQQQYLKQQQRQKQQLEQQQRILGQSPTKTKPLIPSPLGKNRQSTSKQRQNQQPQPPSTVRTSRRSVQFADRKPITTIVEEESESSEAEELFEEDISMETLFAPDKKKLLVADVNGELEIGNNRSLPITSEKNSNNNNNTISLNSEASVGTVESDPVLTPRKENKVQKDDNDDIERTADGYRILTPTRLSRNSTPTRQRFSSRIDNKEKIDDISSIKRPLFVSMTNKNENDANDSKDSQAEENNSMTSISPTNDRMERATAPIILQRHPSLSSVNANGDLNDVKDGEIVEDYMNDDGHYFAAENSGTRNNSETNKSGITALSFLTNEMKEVDISTAAATAEDKHQTQPTDEQQHQQPENNEDDIDTQKSILNQPNKDEKEVILKEAKLWSVHQSRSNNGKEFYFNSETSQTTWFKPYELECLEAEINGKEWPLKKTWIPMVSSKGHPYFYNPITGENRWDNPDEMATIKEKPKPDWEEVNSPLGEVFYLHSKTGEKRWTKPVELGGSPNQWIQFENEGKKYYYHEATGETSWTLPDGAIL